MVILSRIYTKGGDTGRTSLGDGTRVAKHAVRVAAYGTVDEANAAIGIARLHAADEADAMLARIQNDLFDLGADLCRPGSDPAEAGALRVQESQVLRLEAEIDLMNAGLRPLDSFVLPGRHAGRGASPSGPHGHPAGGAAGRRPWSRRSPSIRWCCAISTACRTISSFCRAGSTTGVPATCCGCPAANR